MNTYSTTIVAIIIASLFIPRKYSGRAAKQRRINERMYSNRLGEFMA
jgi:hypothetical protein